MPVKLDAASVDVTAARGLPASSCSPTAAACAYGELHLDRASLAWLTAHAPDIEDELTRGSAWVTLWDAMLDGEISSDGPDVAGAARVAPREQRAQRSAHAVVYRREAYWQFTPAAGTARAGAAPRERAPRGAGRRRPQSLKSAWFSALEGLRRDARDGRVADARLEAAGERCRTDACRRPTTSGWRRSWRSAGCRTRDAMVDEQIERTKNPDRKAQLEFVRPALSSDAGRARPWFASLGDVANRRHEPWVLDGLALPAPSAAHRRVRAVHRAQPRHAARDSTHRRHLLSEALDGRHPERLSVSVGRVNGSGFARSAAADLSGQTPADHPLVGRRPVQSRGTKVTTCRTTFDRAMPRIAPRDPWRASADARLLRRFACAPLLHVEEAQAAHDDRQHDVEQRKHSGPPRPT